jgi:hypothetical protein
MGTGTEAMMYHNPNDLRHDDPSVREAVRYALVVAVLSVLFVIVAAMWVSTCQPLTVDTAACGPPVRTAFALGGPLILMVGGLRAFLRTYQVWREEGIWWPWQGAGWFLMTLMITVLAMSLPTIGGSALLG